MDKKSARLREDLDTCERAAKAAAAAYDMVIAEKPPVTQMGLFAELDAEETNLKAKAEELRQAIQASAQAAEQVVQEKRQKLADLKQNSVTLFINWRKRSAGCLCARNIPARW